MRNGKPTAHSVDVRVDQHEAICAERYAGIMVAINGLQRHVSLLHSRALTAMGSVIALLAAICIGLIGYVFAKLN